MIVNVVKTQEADLVKALGISTERAEELGNLIGNILDVSALIGLSLPETLGRIAKVCETNEELTLIMFTMGEGLAEQRIMSSAIRIDPGDLEDVLSKIQTEVPKGPKKFDPNVN